MLCDGSRGQYCILSAFDNPVVQHQIPYTSGLIRSLVSVTGKEIREGERADKKANAVFHFVFFKRWALVACGSRFRLVQRWIFSVFEVGRLET